MKEVMRWSTENIAPDRRLRFWRDAVHESLVEMDLKPTGSSPSFMSSIEACQLACIAPHQARGSAQRVSRGPTEIARGGKNAYYLLSQPERPWRIQHAGQDQLVQAGESVLVDSREPYEFLFGEGLDDLSVEMPTDWLERWLPDPGVLLGRPLQCSNGWGKALRGFKEALVPGYLTGLAVPEAMLEDQLGVLLSLASEQTGSHEDVKADQLSACMAVMHQHLGDTELVAAWVAQRCHISVRSLHRLFAAAQKTFAGVLMNMRLDEATRMLSIRRFDGLTISEVSRRCGFVDASHFARQFRRQRGRSPRQFRMSKHL
jgi:AraC family transcriptional regulator, positive regulator of tynA and feaB